MGVAMMEYQGPKCGHTACSQNYIDNGDKSCIEGERIRLEHSNTLGEIERGHRKDYVLSGNEVVTLVGKASRYTYRVTKIGKGESRATHWVHVLRGMDNTKDFTFLGGITERGFYVSGKSSIRDEAPCAQAFVWFWENPEDERVTVLHAGICGRCGRLLTTPESIRTGLGPVCAQLAAAGR